MKIDTALARFCVRSLTLCGLGAALFLINPAAHAAVTTYIGSDVGAGPGDPRPNSDAASSSFDAAVGPETVFTFESASVGSFSSLTLGSATVTGTDFYGNDQTIMDTPDFATQPSLAGYNTTPAGANYLNVAGGTVTFTFSMPVTNFGGYFTGVQTVFGTVTLGFNDGTDETLTIPALPDDSGGVSFVGFTDSNPFSSLTLTSGSDGAGDFIGLDDLLFSNIPEPSTYALFAVGGALLFVVRRFRRSGSIA